MELEDSTMKNNLQILSFKSLDKENSLFKDKWNGMCVAVKKIALDSTTQCNKEDCWQKIIKLTNENVVAYYHNFWKGSFRYIVMEFCFGSILDYCNKTLTNYLDLDSCKMTMWEILRGLEYLHDNDIVHGGLVLDKILLRNNKVDSNTIVKIALKCCPHISNSTAYVEDDLFALGNIFYSITTGNIEKPKQEITLVLRLFSVLKTDNQKRSALILVKSLLKCNPHFKPSSVKQLLTNPLFTQNVENARQMLTDTQIGDVEKLQNWYCDLKILRFNQDDFEDLKQIVVSTAGSSIPEIVTKAFEHYSEMFSEFIWYLSTSPTPNEKNLKFTKEKVIESGAYGTVYRGIWIDKDGNQIPAACKMLKEEKMLEDEEFYKEVEAMKQLNHLFVIKFLGTTELKSRKCIIMELCEGTLENYVLGELEEKNIKQNSLDDKFLLGQVTLGLAYIHSKRMIHKDLKPANILLWRKSTLILAKIADFGFAKQLKPTQSEFSETRNLGTKDCMAPELLTVLNSNQKKASASFESDAYSLGITIAFTVLKGRHPYGSQIHVKSLLMSIGCDPILLDELEWAVTDLILRLTKKEPKERPQIALVIYHPYFTLSNDKTKSYFTEKVSDYFSRMRDINFYQESFYKKNILNWVDTIKHRKENDGNAKAIYILQQYDKKTVQETLDNIERLSGNYEKIEKAITSCNSEHLYSCLDQNYPCITRFLKRLITAAPELFVFYLWELIWNRARNNKSLFSDNNKQTTDIFKNMTECTIGFLFLKTPKEKEEMWGLEMSTRNENSFEEIMYYLKQELPIYATPKGLLKTFIKNAKDINYVKNDEGTLLCWALKHTWYINGSIIKTLLKKGAKPNLLVRKTGQNAIHLAAMNESSKAPKILKLLFKNGGLLSSAEQHTTTPLHYLAFNESSSAPKILKVLLKNGGNPKCVDKSNLTPVYWAAFNRSKSAPEVVKLLLKNGGCVNCVDPYIQNTPIHVATLNNSEFAPEIMKVILANGGNVNSVDQNKQTPLHIAAQIKSDSAPKKVEVLLGHGGINVNCVDKNNHTPLYMAVVNKSNSTLKILKILLEHGGNANHVAQHNLTPLHIAAMNDSNLAPEIIMELLKNGGNVNCVAKNNLTPLHMASMNHSNLAPEIVMELLKNGGNVNCMDKNNRTPLHMASINKSNSAQAILKLLIENDGHVNSLDDENQTPLHMAATNESKSAPEMLKILIENGGNVNSADKYNITPIYLAAKNESISAPNIIKVLLENGGNVNNVGPIDLTQCIIASTNESSSAPDIIKALTENGTNINSVADSFILLAPLHIASMNKSNSAPDIVKVLIEKGGEVNSVAGLTDRTSLHIVAINESNSALQMLKVLLENGGNVNCMDKYNQTPLHIAAKSESNSAPQMLKVLLEYGGNVNCMDKNKYTPLHIAVKKKSNSALDIVKVLLENGADANSVASSTLTPLHIAATNESNLAPEILQLLIKNEGNVNCVDQDNQTPIHIVAINESNSALQMLKILLENGGNVNSVDEDNQTPLHMAAKNESNSAPQMLKVLIEYGVNVNCMDKYNQTPLHVTAINESNLAPQMLKVLLENGGNINSVDEDNQTPLHVVALNESNSAPQMLKVLLENGGNVNSVDKYNVTPIEILHKSKLALRMLKVMLEHEKNASREET